MKLKQMVKAKGKTALINALKFTFNVLFAYLYQVIFGMDNILVGVAICVGLTTLPDMDLGIRPIPMCGILVFLYAGAGLAAQFALGPIWAALPVYFIFVAAILLLSSEPVEKKTSISFLLTFVFCQANPVAPERVGMRMLSLVAGGLLVSAVLLVKWKYHHIGENGRTLAEQIQLCANRKGYILRSAVGISIAMALAALLGLKRPMWISIVVMSLTQVHFEETKQRIMYRSMATILGAAVFAGVLIPFIPKEYSILFILAIGYISFFTTKYKYTQIVNAINALNASLIVLEPEAAIVSRVFCLSLGIAVVLGVWELQFVTKKAAKCIPDAVSMLGKQKKNYEM